MKKDNRAGNLPGSEPSKHDESKLRETAETLGRETMSDKDLEFEQLYKNYKAKVMSTAYRLVGNRADAEDITQDVFVKVYRSMGSFRGESAVSTWVYRITVNACYDFLRRRKRESAVSLDDCLEPSVESGTLKELIESAVAKLPDAYRKVFTLYDIQGLKHSEIAEVLGITEGTSKSLLHRARAQLRQRLGPYIKEWRCH